MNRTIKTSLGLWAAACLFAATPARADVPPPDVCQTENAVCHNAGDHYDQDGVCTASTCQKGSASGQVTTYDCLLCKPKAMGAAGSSEVPNDEPKDDGGCSVRTLGTEKGIAALMLGLGVLALGISRRRR